MEYQGLWGEAAELPKWAQVKRAPVAEPGQTAQERMALHAARGKLEGTGKVAGKVAGKGKRQPLNAYNREMVAAYGGGPDGATCGGCAHLFRKQHNAGEYLKCSKHGDTAGPGTDMRLKWPACGLYTPRPKTMTPPTKTRGKLEVVCPVCGAPLVLRAWYPNDRNLVTRGTREPGEVWTKQHGVAVYVGANSAVTRVEVAW